MLLNIWINCPTQDVADHIAEALLSRRLIAASNCYPEIRSRYRWQGVLHERSEIPLLVKTREKLFPQVTAAVQELHPYETPSITSTAVLHASADYVAWVIAGTIDPQVT